MRIEIILYTFVLHVQCRVSTKIVYKLDYFEGSLLTSEFVALLNIRKIR